MIYSLHLPAIYDPGKNLRKLFISTVLKRSAILLLSLFSPIYIYQSLIGYRIPVDIALICVALFFVVLYGTKFFALFFAEKVSRKFGFKGTMRVSVIPFLLFVAAFYFSGAAPAMFYIAAVFWGIHAGLYWWGYHGYFINFADKRHFGKSIGEVDFLVTTAMVITPLVGAVIVTYLGFNSLFIISAIVMVAGIALLGKDNDKRGNDFKSIISIFSLIWKHRKVAVAYIGSSIQGSFFGNIWQLYLFIVLGGLYALGVVVSLSALVAAFMAIIIGELVDKNGERKTILTGSPLVSATWIIRLFAVTPALYILSDSMWQFGERMVSNSLETLTYQKAKDGKLVSAILFREVTLTIGIFISLATFILVVALGGSIKSTLPILALVSFIPFFVFLKNGNKK